MSSKQSKTSDMNSGAADDHEEEFGMEIRDAPPTDLLFEIESFSKLSKHGIHKQESSHVIVAGNYKWRLIIYPNGRECKNEGDHISVYLSVADIDTLPLGWEVNANCSIFIHNHITDKYICFRGGRVRRFDAKNPKWGFSISKRTFTDASNGYLVDDKCLFGGEVFISKGRHAVECMSLHDWKISDFSKLVGIWYSEEFSAGGLRWKMKLYPNGNKTGEGMSVSIYLECVDAKSKSFATHEKVKADFSIRVKNKLPDLHLSKSLSHWFTYGDTDWGYDYFIPISDMRDQSKGFIINDCCFLETQISVFKGCT